MKYKSLIADNERKTCQLTEADSNSLSLLDSEVMIKSSYSGINYKDALGVTFSAPIFKKNLIIPGIDVSGVVIATRSKKFKEGDKVLINGMGFGETIDGGFSEVIKAPEEILVPLPTGLSLKDAMILGTSGYTAALAIDRMIENGQTFDKGPILVSGATGGVGQFAVQILNQLGFFVEALTSRKEYTKHLEKIGAHLVSETNELLSEKSRPLEASVWGGAIDNIGGSFLETVLPRIGLWGNVSSIGLAKNSEFQTTVMPFILRGVSLLGASSNNCSLERREKLWELLATDWKPLFLKETLSAEIKIEDIVSSSERIIQRQSFGKIIIKYF